MVMILKRLLFLFTLSASVVHAQNNVAYIRHPSFLGHYYVIVPENGMYLKEEYSYFKYMYGLVSRDTLTARELSKMQSKHNWNKHYKKYHICDSTVNRIRNEGAMAVTYNEVYEIADQRLGPHNWFAKNHVFHWLLFDNIYKQNCADNFEKVQASYRDKWLRQIDSVKSVQQPDN